MIIGVVGPIGSGKSVFSRRLESQGFERLSFSDSIREYMRIKGIELTRKNIQDTGDSIRLAEGKGAWARKLIEQVAEGKNYVIDGFRNPGEVEEFKKLGNFRLVFVDSSFEERFRRLLERGRSEDSKSEDEFRKADERDRGIGQAEHGQQNAKCFEMADLRLDNSSTLEDFNKKVDEIVEQLRRNP